MRLFASFNSFRRYSLIILTFWGLLSLSAHAHELDDLLNEAAEHNPTLQSARYQTEQMMLAYDELQEFFDPALIAAIGQADRSRSIPGASGYTVLANNATELQAGVDTAVEPGFYIAAGISERLYNDEDGYDYLGQTLFGIRIRIPLLKDRQFAMLDLKKQMAMADYNASASNLLHVAQTLRRDVTLAYIAAYEALSSYRVTQEATQRFQRLVEEAQSLNRLHVIPEYQIFDAQMDLQLGLSNEESARNKFELALITLSSLIGGHRQVTLQNSPDILFEIASSLPDLEDIPLEQALENRGTYQQLRFNMDYARIQIASALEEQKDDVSLNMGVSWQGECHDHFDGSYRYTTDRHVGADIALVWKRSMDYRGPRARKARYEARMNQLKAQLQSKTIDIQAEIMNATRQFKTAKKRIDIISKGLEVSLKTVEAEQERFRLGESTSSSVTDAQKELTNLQQNRTSAAADLLRAHTQYQFAIGFNSGKPSQDSQDNP